MLVAGDVFDNGIPSNRARVFITIFCAGPTLPLQYTQGIAQGYGYAHIRRNWRPRLPTSELLKYFRDI